MLRKQISSILCRISFAVFYEFLNKRSYIFHEFCVRLTCSCHTIEIHKTLDNRVHTSFKSISSVHCHLDRRHHLLSERYFSECLLWEICIEEDKISFVPCEILLIFFSILSHENEGRGSCMKTDILQFTMTIEHLCQAHSVSCLLYHILSL